MASKAKILTDFIRQAPPGELPEVHNGLESFVTFLPSSLSDLKVLAKNEEAVLANLGPGFLDYHLEHLSTVSLPDQLKPVRPFCVGNFDNRRPSSVPGPR